jgi:hypothetical protein
MIITYQGENYFKLQSGSTTILIDPVDQRSFKGANVVLNTKNPSITEEPMNNNEIIWINHGGEYEVGGIRINGWYSESNDEEKTIYRIDFEGFRIIVLGYLENELNEELQEHLSDVDIVLTPAGGGDFISSSKLAKFIRQIEPSLIIPAYLGEINDFSKEFNIDKCEKEDKIVVRKGDLKEGSMEVRCLKN